MKNSGVEQPHISFSLWFKNTDLFRLVARIEPISFYSLYLTTARDLRYGIALCFQLERSTVPGTSSLDDVFTNLEIAMLGAAVCPAQLLLRQKYVQNLFFSM